MINIALVVNIIGTDGCTFVDVVHVVMFITVTSEPPGVSSEFNKIAKMKNGCTDPLWTVHSKF